MSGATDVGMDDLAGYPLPKLGAATDKDRRGRVLVVAGGAMVPGAPILTGLACLRAGAGKLQIAASERFAPVLGAAVPEGAILEVDSTVKGEMTAEAAQDLVGPAARCDAVVIGPGLSDEAAAGGLTRGLLRAAPEVGFVVDAAALTGIGLGREATRGLGGNLVITPHAGEMASLLGAAKNQVEADPLMAAREAAQALQAVCVMKGAETFIATPDGRTWRHTNGGVGLATSGSGDVLAGVIGGLLARGASPLTAAIWGVCLHGWAGARLADRVGPVGFLARELLDEIPRGLVAAGSRVG